MSKVIVYHAVAKDPYPVAAATITTGWMPGQVGMLDTTGKNARLAITDGALFVLADDEDELSAPPTGSLVTCIYGSGTKLVIDHSEEVALSSSDRAYASTCEAGAVNQDLYVDAAGKFTTTATGSVKAKMIQVPAAANNYSLGILLRI